MRARIHILPKIGVLDPQGKAIEHALGVLGFVGIGRVSQGKVIDLELAETDPIRARATAQRMCESVLANSVVETFSIELKP